MDEHLENETFGQQELRQNLQHFTKEELVEMVVKANGPNTGKDFFDMYWAADHERRRLEFLLKSEYHTDKALRHAVHVADLEKANKQLRREIRLMQEHAERRNLEIFATGLIVRCTGCEQGAPFNADELTEERIQEVERIARRLRSWWQNHLAREMKKTNQMAVGDKVLVKDQLFAKDNGLYCGLPPVSTEEAREKEKQPPNETSSA